MMMRLAKHLGPCRKEAALFFSEGCICREQYVCKAIKNKMTHVNGSDEPTTCYPSPPFKSRYCKPPESSTSTEVCSHLNMPAKLRGSNESEKKSNNNNNNVDQMMMMVMVDSHHHILMARPNIQSPIPCDSFPQPPLPTSMISVPANSKTRDVPFPSGPAIPPTPSHASRI
jgi:hypothetical protein